MVSVLIDTNILIDYLNGIEQAKTELDRYSDKAISLITWMKVNHRILLAPANIEIRQAQLPKTVTPVTNFDYQPASSVVLIRCTNNNKTIKTRGTTATNRQSSVLSPQSFAFWHDYCCIIQQHTSRVLTSDLVDVFCQLSRMAIQS